MSKRKNPFVAHKICKKCKSIFKMNHKTNSYEAWYARKYCSIKCKYEDVKKFEKKCPECKKLFIVGIKGKKQVCCSISCGSKYSAKKRPSQKIRVNFTKKCNTCGQQFKQGENEKRHQFLERKNCKGCYPHKQHLYKKYPKCLYCKKEYKNPAETFCSKKCYQNYCNERAIIHYGEICCCGNVYDSRKKTTRCQTCRDSYGCESNIYNYYIYKKEYLKKYEELCKWE
tara:strand:- start:558 stop:1238 length:681 start_codon:yes stop_codon:yes gene_type:complete